MRQNTYIFILKVILLHVITFILWLLKKKKIEDGGEEKNQSSLVKSIFF